VQKFVHPYVDGEFDPSERARFAAHILGCCKCREAVAFEQSFKASLKAQLPRVPAPESLRLKVSAALDAAPPPPRSFAWRAWRLVPVAVAAGLLVTLTFHGHDDEDLTEVAGDVVGIHARNMPIEVSGSAGAVRSWLDGKVDFTVNPPQIPDATLEGARLCDVHEREAACFTYRVADGSRLTMVVFDPRGLDLGAGPYMDQESGYSVAAFRNHGLGYAITGDVNTAQMSHIVDASFQQ
jgi:anti-sigma factor RsiW